MAWIFLSLATVLILSCVIACSPPSVLSLDSEAAYSFADVEPNLDKSDLKSFTIGNAGGQELHGTILTDRNWLHVETDSISITKGEQNISLWVDTRDMDYEFSDTGTIQIQTNGGTGSIKVSLSTVSEPITIKIDTILVGKNPQYVWVNPNTNRICVYNDEGFTYLAKVKLSSPTGDDSIKPAGSTLSIIDGNTNKVLCTRSGYLINLVANSANKKVDDLYWVGCEGDIKDVQNLSTNLNLERIFPTMQLQVTLYGTEGHASLTSFRGDILAVDFGKILDIDKIVNYDPAVSKTVAGNPGTNRIYTLDSDNNSISVTDGASNKVITIIKVGSHPVAIAVNPTINRIYVANKNDNTVSVIKGDTNKVLSIVTVGREPVDIVVNPNTNRIYVSNWLDGTVSVLEDKDTK
jgi:YVTN family beta-propeller protein